MILRELELINLLVGAYQTNTLKAIEACINGMDISLNVRNLALDAVLANKSYLDMRQCTRREFQTASLFDCFSPDDKANGNAQKWIGAGAVGVNAGHGAQTLRIWDGKEVKPVYVELITIRPWVITGFIPRRSARLEAVPFDRSLAVSRLTHIAHRVRLKAC